MNLFALEHFPQIVAQPPVPPSADEEQILLSSSASRVAGLPTRLSGLQARSERNSEHRNAHIHVPTAADREVELFLSFPSVPFLKDSKGSKVLNDPIDFWKLHRDEFPILSLAVRKFWVCPASEAPSERIFSKLTALVNKGKVCLDSHRVSRLIFMSMNISI